MVLNCAVNMLIGGALALYIRELYKRFGTSISNRDNFSGVFPMLTMVTVVIIFVVKSSLALSLGLVGALSIVRFRAAIKTSEELVYLFLCIGVGLALGAEHRLLAAVTVVIVTIFVVGRRVSRLERVAAEPSPDRHRRCRALSSKPPTRLVSSKLSSD